MKSRRRRSLRVDPGAGTADRLVVHAVEAALALKVALTLLKGTFKTIGNFTKKESC